MSTGTPPPRSLDGFFKHCPELVFIADRGGAILERGAAFDQQIAPGDRFADLIHPEDKAAFDAGWARLQASEEPAMFECRLHCREGYYRSFAWSARRAPESGEIYGALRVPYAKAAEKEATAKEQIKILQAITDNLNIIVWAVDKNAAVTYLAGKGLDAPGLKPERLVGVDVFTLYSEDLGTRELRQAIGGEKAHTVIVKGGKYWEIWFLPLKDERGEVESVVGVSLNITEAKRAENELRETLELIQKQQSVIRTLSTPILQVWDGVLALPMMGTVDSSRAAEVMNSLLQEVTRTRSRHAILDVTGVDAMDTATASHLLRLVGALRLLGAEGIITGIQPSIAQTMVGLGVDLAGIKTLSNLRDGLRVCMQSGERERYYSSGR